MVSLWNSVEAFQLCIFHSVPRRHVQEYAVLWFCRIYYLYYSLTELLWFFGERHILSLGSPSVRCWGTESRADAVTGTELRTGHGETLRSNIYWCPLTLELGNSQHWGHLWQRATLIFHNTEFSNAVLLLLPLLFFSLAVIWILLLVFSSVLKSDFLSRPV